MRLYRFLLAFFVSVVVLSSCSERRRLSRELAQFTSGTIVIPSSLHKVLSGKVTAETSICQDLPVMIMYNDFRTCNLCQITHLHDRAPIYALSDSLGTFAVMTIFSPDCGEYEEVVAALIEHDFDFPVYIDPSGDFARFNSCIPEDTRFHCFLVDRESRPIFVGNPVSSTELWDLFIQVLDCISNIGK